MAAAGVLVDVAPPPPLAGLVERIWFVDHPGGGGRERRLPDGGLEIVLHLEGEGASRVGGGEPTFLVAGPRTRAETLDTSAPGRLVGAHLCPGSARALLGLPASEVRDQDVDLHDVWGGWAEELAERVAGAGAPGAMLDALARGLVERADLSAAPSGAVGAAMARLISDPGGTRVAELVDGAGLSWARFIRGFEDASGLTPKRFQRVMRLQRAVRGLRRPTLGGAAAVALDAGCADQSHLVREFRALADLTPGDYLRAAPEAANHVPLPAKTSNPAAPGPCQALRHE